MRKNIHVITLFTFLMIADLSVCISGSQYGSELVPGSDSIKTIDGEKLSVGHLDEFILKAMDSVGVPGLSIAIINDANIVYHRAFGVTDIEKKTPVTDKTIFEGASLSKPLFAYFVMKMVEKGVLNLDEPYFPALANRFTRQHY